MLLLLLLTFDYAQVFQDSEVVLQLIASDVEAEGESQRPPVANC